MDKEKNDEVATFDPTAYRGAELRALAKEARVSLKTAYRWRRGEAGRHTSLLIERVIQNQNHNNHDDQEILSPSADRNGR